MVRFTKFIIFERMKSGHKNSLCRYKCYLFNTHYFLSELRKDKSFTNKYTFAIKNKQFLLVTRSSYHTKFWRFPD